MKKTFLKTLVLGLCLILGSKVFAQSISVSDYVDMYDNTTYSTNEYTSPGFYTNYVTYDQYQNVLTPWGWYHGGAYVTITTDGDYVDICDGQGGSGAVLPELSDDSIQWSLSSLQDGQATLHVAFTGPNQTALFRIRATEYNSGIWTYANYDLHFTSQ